MNKACNIEVKEVDTQQGVEMFAKIDKRQEWLMHAAAGRGARKGSLSRTKLIETIRDTLIRISTGGDSNPSLDDAANLAVAADPMGALAAMQEEPDAHKRRKVYVSKRRKDHITEIDMPELEPTKHPDSSRRRTVRLSALSTNSLWVSTRDLDWLVTWLANEVETGGAPMDDELASNEAAVAALEQNCRAPGVHIRWDVDDAWEAVILAGSQEGTRVKSYVEKLTREKWEKASAVHKYATTFDKATRQQRKEATYDFLEQHLVDACQSA